MEAIKLGFKTAEEAFLYFKASWNMSKTIVTTHFAFYCDQMSQHNRCNSLMGCLFYYFPIDTNTLVAFLPLKGMDVCEKGKNRDLYTCRSTRLLVSLSWSVCASDTRLPN